MKKTEKELIQNHQQNLFLVDKQIAQTAFTIEELGATLSGVVHLNCLKSHGVNYLNPSSTNLFGLTLDEMNTLGSQFLTDYIQPDDLSEVQTQLYSFSQENDTQAVCTFIQRVKATGKNTYEYLLTSSKICKNNQELISISIHTYALGRLARKIEKAIEQDAFMQKNFDRFLSLTKREKEVLTKIALGYTNQEIANELFISPHTVRTHRNRIHQKLEISRFREVMLYAQAFDLI